MKHRNIQVFLFVLLVMLLTACGSQETIGTERAENTSLEGEGISGESDVETIVEDTDVDEAEGIATESKKEISKDPMYVDFTAGQPAGFEAANGWCNGSMFNVTWRKRNVTFNEGKMQLIIDKDATPANGVPYSGGEFRSKEFYGYGRYEVSMKAIKNDGVVTSFFTYTGPSDNNPWDEIDIEILGKDTTKVQFNYFTNSKGEHEYMHELGFDASEDFHTYAFEWYEDKIIWFVDGAEVYSATVNIPVTKGKIMMNAWCGTGVDDWLNAFDDTTLPLAAEYQWIKYTPFE